MIIRKITSCISSMNTADHSRITELAAAGITIGAYATYKIASKIGEEYFDKNIRAGTVFQTLVGSDPDKHPGQRIYAAYKKGDKGKYIGLYGRHLRMMKGEVTAVLNKAATNIKIPSERNAKKIFEQLTASNDGQELRQMVDKMAGVFYTQPALPRKMRDEMTKAETTGKLSDEAFKKYGQQIFNIGLVAHDNAIPGVEAMQQKYYKLLKDAGYNAIGDLNDKRYSGYNAKAPAIIFDMGSVTREAVNKVTDLKIQQEENKLMQQMILGASATAAVGIASSAAVNELTNPTVASAPKQQKQSKYENQKSKK